MAEFTVYGYKAEALALVAELLRKHMITEDELDTLFHDFSKMYNIIVAEQKTVVSEMVAAITWPSLGDVYKKMRGVENLFDAVSNIDWGAEE